MGDISNKTLAGLVILAIIVSLVSLFVGRARIVTVGKAPTAPGVVEADVEADIDITVTNTPIDFGIVYAGDQVSSESNCAIADCTVEAGNTWDTLDCPFGTCNRAMPGTSNKYLRIQSVGTTPTNIRVSASRSLFCNIRSTGAPNAGRAVADDSFMAKVKVTGAASPCGSLDASWTEMNFKNVVVDGTNNNIAGTCNIDDNFDMYFKIWVAGTEPTSEVTCPHDTTLTFEGVSAV